MDFRENSNGIMLIALVITIIVLLILVGVTLKLVGDDGIIAKAKWSAYVTEYEAVEEQKEMYATTYYMDKFSQKKNVRDVYKMASLSLIAKTTDEKIARYPVSEKLEIGSMYNSLKETIKYMENLQDSDLENEDLVNLYKVDFEKISANAKKTYAINIVSGMLYSIEYEEYQGKYYHTPRYGISSSLENEKIDRNITEPGTYEIIVDAGQIVSWDSVVIQYYKYVENSLNMKIYTSDDEINWNAGTIELGENADKREKYNIVNADRTRFLKVEITIEDVNGTNAELDYILVNFYKFRKTDVEPEITTDAEEKNGIYTVPTGANGETEASGSANVNQKIEVPTDDDEYMINIDEIFGKPSISVTIENTDGSKENYTVSSSDELKKINVKPGAKVEINATLNAGDGIGKAELLAKEKDVSSDKKTTASANAQSDNWRTVEQKRYMYNNGGTGYWEKCLVNGVEVDETGIIIESESAVKRTLVRYQVSSDGSSWSGYFTNIEEAENTQFLRVVVDYQVKGDIEYGDTSKNTIKVILNDGSWKVSFMDENGNVLLNKYVYFENSSKKGTLQLPKIDDTAENGKTLIGWKKDTTNFDMGTTQTISAHTVYNGVYLDLNIDNVEELCEFRDVVNAGLTLSGFTVNLMNDLDLSSVCSATLGSWEPIGRQGAGYFNGKFEGNNHAINNVYIKSNESWAKGLFGVLDSEGVVRNLKVSGEITCTYSSGIAAGGIVGRNNGTIENCTNYASITRTSTNGSLGGICGNNTNTITNCVNYGTINGIKAGGIAGNNASNSQIDKCRNEGTITGKENIAGICGYQTAGNISNCSNSGIVTGTEYIAGVCGYQLDGNISSCSNSGAVTGTNCLAGICGDQYNGSISNCSNSGTITGTNYIAGICGYQVDGDITNCLNSGNVDGIYTFGGIVSYNKSTVSLCANTGGITCYKSGNSADSLIGGIAGVNEGTVEKCFNKGNVTNSIQRHIAGGIVGRNLDMVRYCANSGNVKAVAVVGGIVGNNRGYIEYVYNTAQVEELNTTTIHVIGGISGNCNTIDSAYIKNAYNIGKIIVCTSTTSYSGGIVGKLFLDYVITACYNAGEISGGTAGSIFGATAASSTKKVTNNGTTTQNEMKNWTQQDINSKIGSGFVKKTGGLPILNIKIPIYNNFVF